MELKLIQQLVKMMTRAELSELEIEDRPAGFRVHLKRGSEASQAAPLVNVMQGAQVPSAGEVPSGVSPAAAAALGEGPGLAPGTTAFPSPMVGTFYRSPSPDADPFVAAGTRFDEDSVICIIEAMKVMNEIKAETVGEIVEILVENGEPVEFGQPLFLIKAG